MDYASLVGEWTGSGGFRLTPDQAFAEHPSTAQVTTGAGGRALVVAYTWRHPHDGPADGILLAGSPDDAGEIVAAWTDSWGQAPHPMILTGELRGGTATVRGTYQEEWGWEIDIAGSATEFTIAMRNVVPEGGADGLPAGPYDTQILRYARQQAPG